MSEKVSVWDAPNSMIVEGSYTPGSDIDDAVDTSLSLIDRDLFYDPNDEEIDAYIAQQIKDGFDIEEMFEALPEAFSGIYNQIKETVAAVPNTELKKVPGTAIEALARGGTDTADLLMRIGSGMATMGLKVLPGDAATQYHNLPETIKSFSRGWFRQQRTIEQHRAKQMMGDANYSYLPSALVDNTLAEGLTLFADPGMVAGFGASTAARAMAKAAIKGGKSGIVSRGLVNAAVKTGQMQDALFGAVGSVAKLPVTGSVKVLQGATEFISEGFQAVKANLPKTTKGVPVEVDLPTEGKIGFTRRKINQVSNITDDAMELASQIKLQAKRQNLPSALDRIARDSSVRPGARDLASMFDAMGKNPLSRGLLIPAYKTGKSIGKGAATGGALGLLSFDEEFAASSIAGGAMFGPFGELASEIIFSKEKNRQQITNFVDDFKVKLDPDDLINFEAFTEGSREDQKFFAGLSYMFKNGHFRNGEGNLDVRFLDDEQYQKFGELRGERFGDTSGVNYVSSGGRNTVLINTDKKKYKREALAHELGHAIMKMPEVQDSLQVQDKLLFGDRVVKSEGGKEVLAFNYEGLLNKDWVDSFFENYVNGLDDITQKEYRSLSAEKKFLVARDEIHADSMRYFFKEFDPESFIRAGKVNNLKFRTKGSYERNLYNGLGGSLARGIVNNVLLARNSLGLYAVRNMAKSMGLIKDGTPLKLNDGRVFSNISEILEKKRENIRATDDPITDVIGNKWNLAKLNSKDSRDILSSFLPTVDIIRDENGDPVIRNGRYRFLNKRQRQKHDAERAKIVKEAIDSARQSGESRMHLSRVQELSNESYSGDYFTKEAIDAMIATSKRVITPHLLDTIMRLNDRMKGRTTDSGFIAEFVYNQVTETGKITPDITTSYRQMIPMIFEMSKTGRNFRVTGIDMNDLMSRLDRFEKADFKSERGKVFDIWRQDYRKFGGKDADVDLSHNPIRDLFLQDLWLYLSGLSEGKSGIDALGGKGNTNADLQSVTAKRDGLMRFLGFEKKDQEAINPNMFQELVDRNRIIKSFRLDRMQNLSISDHDGKINFGSYLGVQLNRMPTQRSSFMGDPDASARKVRDQEIPIEVITTGVAPEAKRIQEVINKIGEQAMTETVAENLGSDLNAAFKKVGVDLQVTSMKVGQGGFEMSGEITVAPNIVISVKGDVSQGKLVMDSLSLAWDQEGGNIIRRPTVDEMNATDVKKFNAVRFGTGNLSADQKKAFFTDLYQLKDEDGNSFLTGYTETSEGMFIGDQWYDEGNGKMVSEIDRNRSQITSLAAKHKVSGYDIEKVIMDTFDRPTADDRLKIIEGMGDLERAVFDVGVNRIKTAVRKHQTKGDDPGMDDATMDLVYDRNKKGEIIYEKEDKPKVLKKNYDFLDSPLVQSIIDDAGDTVQATKDLQAIVKSLNTSKLDKRNKLSERQQKLYDKIVDQYSDAFAEDFGQWKDDPDILSAIGWYSGVAKNIGKLIPNDSDRHIFLEFLGGTSPNTSVEQNFLYAIDLFNRWKTGGLKKYVNARDKTFKAYENGSLIAQSIFQTETPVWSKTKGKFDKDAKGNKIQQTDKDGNLVFEYKWKSTQARNRFIKSYAKAESGNKSKNEYDRSVLKARSIAKKITPHDLLNVALFDAGAIPVRKNGGKYGVHTDRVFQIVEGVWERDTDAPKAVNFTGNLKGTRTTATIDVWAARLLRRIGYDKGVGPWRIQPMAESGVKNSDFYFGQDAFEAATTKIAKRYGDKFKMSPDDLQAVMWFAEKRNWAQKGWSRVEDFGDFRDYLYSMQQQGDGTLKLKDAVLGSTSEDFFNSLEFDAEDLLMPAATRKRRVDLVDKILGSGRKIERARNKVNKMNAQVDAAKLRVTNSKTDAAKSRAKIALAEKRKLSKQAQKSLDELNDSLRNMRGIRMTLEEKPVTYSR